MMMALSLKQRPKRTDQYCEVRSASYIDAYESLKAGINASIEFVMRREDFDECRILNGKKHEYPSIVEWEGAEYNLVKMALSRWWESECCLWLSSILTSPDELVRQLEKLENFDEVAEAMLTEAEPILREEITSEASTHKDTGEMMGSIKSQIKKNAIGWFLTTYTHRARTVRGFATWIR